MKEKLSAATKQFSAAVVQPVMFLSVTGIILAIGVILKMDVFPDFIKSVGTFIYDLMQNGNINQLSVIFCVGITVALAKRKKADAAILAISEFLFFLYANNAWLSSHNMLKEVNALGLLNGTGQAVVLGVQIVDMGVFLGIIMGCINGYLFNKFCDVEFPDVVRVYGGSRFAFLICSVATVALAIVSCYIWPVVNTAINTGAGLIGNSGYFGLFIYGFLNRILIPTGLHHLIYMPFLFTQVGGTLEMGDNIFTGAQTIWLGQLGDIANLTQIDSSVKYLLFGFSKVFGSIGIVLAFIKTAKPEKKAQIRALLIPLLSVAVLAGITEPLEFMFMFTAPILFVVHSVLDGLFQVLSYALGCRFPIAGGIIAALPGFVVPASITKWYVLIGTGILGIATWYFSFVLLIQKFNLKTPGREDSEDKVLIPAIKEETKGVVKDSNKAKSGLGDINDIIAGLGGKENIVTVNNCMTRLRVDVKDLTLVDEDRIKRFENSGIVKQGKNVQIIIGMKVQTVREDVCQRLGME